MPTRRPLTTAALLALSLILSILPSCGDAGAAPELSIAHQLAPDPPAVGPTQLELEVRTLAGAAVAGAEIRVEATMSHAGMVPVFATCEELEPGRYAGAFELTMGGDWLLIVDVTLADGGTAQHVLEVPGVRPRRSE